MPSMISFRAGLDDVGGSPPAHDSPAGFVQLHRHLAEGFRAAGHGADFVALQLGCSLVTCEMAL